MMAKMPETWRKTKSMTSCNFRAVLDVVGVKTPWTDALRASWMRSFSSVPPGCPGSRLPRPGSNALGAGPSVKGAGTALGCFEKVSVIGRSELLRRYDLECANGMTPTTQNVVCLMSCKTLLRCLISTYLNNWNIWASILFEWQIIFLMSWKFLGLHLGELKILILQFVFPFRWARLAACVSTKQILHTWLHEVTLMSCFLQYLFGSRRSELAAILFGLSSSVFLIPRVLHFVRVFFITALS